jgi:hypothetical protein
LAFAVFEEAVKIATSSSLSFIKAVNFFCDIKPASTIISSQNCDSSASSMAIAIFEIKVGLDWARQAELFRSLFQFF